MTANETGYGMAVQANNKELGSDPPQAGASPQVTFPGDATFPTGPTVNVLREQQMLALRNPPPEVPKPNGKERPVLVPVGPQEGPVTLMQVSPEEVRARAIELSREATIRRLTDPDFAASRNRMSDKAIDTNFHIVPQNQREGDYKLLHQMVQRIDPKGYEDGKYRIAIEDNEEVNASAAGRNIIVNTGLLDKLKDNPDALLGVLAHEIGHCKLEHHLRPLPSEPTASSTRAEVVDYLATQVIRNQAESQADSFAGQRLAELGVPTEPVREFLAYIEGDSVKRTAEVKDVLSRHMPRRDAQRLLDLMQNYPDLRGREGLIAPGSPSVTEPREQ